MAFQLSADSICIRRLAVKCSWWHPRQANDAVCVAVNTYVPIFRGLDTRGGRKLRTDTHTYTHKHTHTHTQDNYSNRRCAMHAEG